ncbi:MAG: zinc-ribbon domain-containing protein, partial [Deltaproteobacteria bacterium]|nr:zinc-ribbon domain-containing protein [Deltaproteobacteria bacterium]
MEDSRDQACQLICRILQEQNMICNDCGALNENDAQFCIHCGGSLSK